MTNLRSGLPADARLLIVNCDDFGMYRAINAAVLVPGTSPCGAGVAVSLRGCGGDQDADRPEPGLSSRMLTDQDQPYGVER